MQAGGRQVKGLMEALQVTAPRTSSSAYLVSGDAQPYPSAAAKADLTAAHASQCIWAAAVLGGSAMFEPETNGLIQVSCFIVVQGNACHPQTFLPFLCWWICQQLTVLVRRMHDVWSDDDKSPVNKVSGRPGPPTHHAHHHQDVLTHRGTGSISCRWVKGRAGSA